MDSKMQASQRAIGGSSDTAQLALSYYADRIHRGIIDDDTQQIYENIIVLAVLAQVAIDGCKRIFAVDPVDEIKRIRRQPCMKRDQDYPLFMKYTHDVPLTKNRNSREYEDVVRDRKKLSDRIDNNIICPMNWIEECLNSIQMSSHTKIVPTKDFFVWKNGRARSDHLGKVRRLVEEYDSWVKQNGLLFAENDEEAIEEYFIRSNEIIEEIRGMKISELTMNHLIASCVGADKYVSNKTKYKKASKYVRKMLNILYMHNKEMFLRSWIKGNDEEKEN